MSGTSGDNSGDGGESGTSDMEGNAGNGCARGVTVGVSDGTVCRVKNSSTATAGLGIAGCGTFAKVLATVSAGNTGGDDGRAGGVCWMFCGGLGVL